LTVLTTCRIVPALPPRMTRFSPLVLLLLSVLLCGTVFCISMNAGELLANLVFLVGSGWKESGPTIAAKILIQTRYISFTVTKFGKLVKQIMKRKA